MDDSSIVDSVILNAVLYPSFPRVVPYLSANIFSYSKIKYWWKLAQIFLSDLVLLFHLSMYLVCRSPQLESLIIV